MSTPPEEAPVHEDEYGWVLALRNIAKEAGADRPARLSLGAGRMEPITGCLHEALSLGGALRGLSACEEEAGSPERTCASHGIGRRETRVQFVVFFTWVRGETRPP